MQSAAPTQQGKALKPGTADSSVRKNAEAAISNRPKLQSLPSTPALRQVADAIARLHPISKRGMSQ